MDESVWMWTNVRINAILSTTLHINKFSSPCEVEMYWVTSHRWHLYCNCVCFSNKKSIFYWLVVSSKLDISPEINNPRVTVCINTSFYSSENVFFDVLTEKKSPACFPFSSVILLVFLYSTLTSNVTQQRQSDISCKNVLFVHVYSHLCIPFIV